MDRRMPTVSAPAVSGEIATFPASGYSARQAAYDMAQDYPGGAAGLAAAIGLNPSTFQKALRGETRYKLDVEALTDMTRAMRDYRAANAFAADVGAMLVMLPDPKTAGAGVLQAVGALTKEMGDYIGRVSDAFADGHITRNELKGCGTELGRLIVRAQQLQALVQAQYDAEHPHHLPAPHAHVRAMPAKTMPERPMPAPGVVA